MKKEILLENKREYHSPEITVVELEGTSVLLQYSVNLCGIDEEDDVDFY